jgi:hypothetical protein
MGDNRYPGDTQFAGLVEAATAAADQEIHWSANAEAMNPDGRPTYEAYETRAPPEDSYNSVPTGQYDDSIATKLDGPSSRKRKRDIVISREGHTVADELLPDRQNAMSDAPRPSAAATSAAAIFRQSSATSKRHTRPPIGKLYSSLQLSPEKFVHLQAAAKAYMLDQNHPERLDTIGQRGRGDTDLVRLKLWNFVKEFLDDLGNGQKFFGDHVPDVDGQHPRTMIWPQDAEQIIKACVPVMRRMVTNERQRQYAMQARKTTEDIHGHESGGTRHVAASSANNATEPPKLSTADIQGLEITDLLNDGCVPGSYEAADWYSEHEGQLGLHTELSSWQLDERDYRVLVANIDGHYRLFHNGDVSQCTEDCEAQAVERLLSWDRLYNPNLTSDAHEQQSRMDGIIHQLFGLVRSSLQPRPPDQASVVLPHPDRVAENHERRHIAVSYGQSGVDKPRVVEKADPTGAVKRTEKRSSEALVLRVNLVSTDASATSSPTFHSPKRLAGPFLLSAVSVPNLQALQSHLQQHFGKTLEQLASSEASGASPSGTAKRETPELSVKVWLPDGLVRVRDDGEWMVALLSAEMVEWMDNEVKILVEILT